MTDASDRHAREEARRREALDTLERLRHHEDGLGSALAGAAKRAGDHFTAKDATSDAAASGAADPMELWGRRIGRGLALIAFVGLCIYLYATYLR